MAYGGPLFTCLSGYHAFAKAKPGSSNFTSSGTGPSSSGESNRFRSFRYRSPSAYVTPSSGKNPFIIPSTLTSTHSSSYTPQTRRRCPNDNTESLSTNCPRYTTRLNISSINGGGTSATGDTASRSSTTTAPFSSPTHAAILSRYFPNFRRSHSQISSRWLREANLCPSLRRQHDFEPHPNYKRLYEAERQDNNELRELINRSQQELQELRTRMEDFYRLSMQQQHPNHQWQRSSGADQTTLEVLRTSSQKLKAERQMLTRMISRLM